MYILFFLLSPLCKFSLYPCTVALGVVLLRAPQNAQTKNCKEGKWTPLHSSCFMHGIPSLGRKMNGPHGWSGCGNEEKESCPHQGFNLSHLDHSQTTTNLSLSRERNTSKHRVIHTIQIKYNYILIFRNIYNQKLQKYTCYLPHYSVYPSALHNGHRITELILWNLIQGSFTKTYQHIPILINIRQQ